MDLPRDPDLDELPDEIPADEALTITAFTDDGLLSAPIFSEQIAAAVADARRLHADE